MFARALIISLLLHLLFFGLSKAGLISLFSRPPVPPREPPRQVINLVDPLPLTAGGREEGPVLTTLPVGVNTVRPSVQEIKPGHERKPLNERVKKEEEKGPVAPQPIANPAGSSPLPVRTITGAEKQPENQKPLVDEGETWQANEGETVSDQPAGEAEPGELVQDPFPPAVPETVVQGGVGNQAGGAGWSGHASAAPGSAPPTGPLQVYHPAPVYPRRARRQGWEGTVYLEAVINREGKVITTKITTSSGYELLDQAARKAVAAWRYAWPVDEPPDEYLVTIKITFQLEE